MTSLVLDESSIHDQTIQYKHKNSVVDPQDYQLFSITEMMSGQPSNRSTVGHGQTPGFLEEEKIFKEPPFQKA